MKKSKSLYHGHRFPAEVISCAVRWYFRFQLSLRDIEELLFERGVTVTYETIRCWCDKFGKGFAHRVKAARQSRGQTFLQACAALEPGTAQDRHRSVAQLSGGKSGDPGTCEREARVRQSGRPTEQPRREQPPTNARTRASHARLSRPETHTEISLVLRADQAILRAQAASAARFTLSHTARGAIHCLARTHRSHPKSVLRVLRDIFPAIFPPQSRQVDRAVENSAADIYMPDLQRMGGYSEMRKAVHYLAAHDLPVAPHTYSPSTQCTLRHRRRTPHGARQRTGLSRFFGNVLPLMPTARCPCPSAPA
jgi:hypothetical protein